MKAELIDSMGTELTVVNAARVSMDKDSSYLYKRDGVECGPAYYCEGLNGMTKEFREGDKKLLSYLAREGHWTPFSHPQICMRETVPIFVARQRFKHMVGFTYNEVSRRYVDTPPVLHDVCHRLRPDGSIKQGSAGHAECTPLIEICGATVGIEDVRAALLDWYDEAVGPEYNIAPETARAELPQSMMTSYYVTGSLSAWARAYKQRSDDHSQLEIQHLAKQWDTIIAPLFPESWKVLTA